MPTTISDGANRITTYGLFRYKHQCFNALKTLQKTRPFGMRWGHEDTVGVSTC